MDYNHPIVPRSKLIQNQKRISVIIDAEVFDKIKAIAQKEQSSSPSDIIRRALQKFVERKGK